MKEKRYIIARDISGSRMQHGERIVDGAIYGASVDVLYYRRWLDGYSTWHPTISIDLTLFRTKSDARDQIDLINKECWGIRLYPVDVIITVECTEDAKTL